LIAASLACFASTRCCIKKRLCSSTRCKRIDRSVLRIAAARSSDDFSANTRDWLSVARAARSAASRLTLAASLSLSRFTRSEPASYAHSA
jgi:hypothetical protein